MKRHQTIKLAHRFHIWALQAMPIVIILALGTSVSYGAALTPASLSLTNDLPSQSGIYSFSMNLPYGETLGSISIEVCSNSPIVTQPCVYPIGYNDSNASLSSENGLNGFSISSSSSANDLILSNAPATVAAGVKTFSFSGIINPSSLGSYYVRLQTYPTTNASGSSTDIGGIAFAMVSAISISTYVPPYLTFCDGTTINGYSCTNASGNLIDFGYLSTKATAAADSQFLIATNAQYGYTVQVDGSSLVSGNNVLPPELGGPSVPGQDQFGMNLVSNTTPQIGQVAQGPGIGLPATNYAQANNFRFNSGDIIAQSSSASDYRKYTVSYIINISPQQPPGVYSTTLTYVSAGNF